MYLLIINNIFLNTNYIASDLQYIFLHIEKLKIKFQSKQFFFLFKNINAQLVSIYK